MKKYENVGIEMKTYGKPFQVRRSIKIFINIYKEQNWNGNFSCIRKIYCIQKISTKTNIIIQIQQDNSTRIIMQKKCNSLPYFKSIH